MLSTMLNTVKQYLIIMKEYCTGRYQIYASINKQIKCYFTKNKNTNIQAKSVFGFKVSDDFFYSVNLKKKHFFKKANEI